MTKRELLNNPVFMELPDDADIVFATSSDLKACVPLTPLNLSAMSQCTNLDVMENLPTNIRDEFHFTPKYKTALVIDAAPYWFLKETYGITFSNKEES